jgi:hypothetical protein
MKLRDVARIRLERVTVITRFCCKQDHAQKLDSNPIFPLISPKTSKKRWFELKTLKFEPKLPYITLHYVGFTLVSSPTSPTRLALPYITIRYDTPDEWCTRLPYVTIRCDTLPYITIPRPMLPYIAIYYTTLPYAALPYTTIRYPAIHYM